MAKKNSFASALKAEAGQGPVPVDAPASNAAKPSRAGRKHIGGYFDPTVAKQLKTLSAEEDTSVQDLLAEALDMLFQAHGKPTIAKRPAS